MGFRFPYVISNTKKILKSSSFSSKNNQQKGHLAIYVGLSEYKRRYVVPLSYLSSPLFQDMLSCAEEEYGSFSQQFYFDEDMFVDPMGGLTIPCDEDMFVDLISQLS